jgi:hypothetical protein
MSSSSLGYSNDWGFSLPVSTPLACLMIEDIQLSNRKAEYLKAVLVDTIRE